MSEPAPPTVAVIGLGLIGGSLAIDLSRMGWRVIGHDADPDSLAAAIAANAVAGALHASLLDLDQADVVVLAVPVDAAISMLPQIAFHARRARLITDVGSTKEEIVRAAAAQAIGARFVGGHPLAGDDRAGWSAARPGLFDGARVLLSPTADTSAEALRICERLWKATGATAQIMDPRQHDRELAWTSHVPQVLSTALAVAFAGAGLRSTQLGTGGRGMVRLAASSPAMWSAIAAQNGTSIADALAQVESVLARARRTLRAADQDGLRNLFDEGHAWLASVGSGRDSVSAAPSADPGAVVVAFQGEPGAHSDEAARSFFEHPVAALPCRSFNDVCDAVLEGRAAFGVLPVENSTAGSVVAAYDALTRSGIVALGEVVRRIRHAVLGLPGAAPGRLRRIISHPIALAQCTNFFRTHRWIEGVAFYDTAGAAIEVARSGDPTLAALAPREAASRYALDLLADDVQDRDDNRTRFLVIAAEGTPHGAAVPAPPDDAPFRSTLLLHVHNHPGALARALAPFARYDVNLTHLQSTPGSVPWSYRFIVELDTAAADDAAAAAIDEIRADGADVRVIGSYPAAAAAA